jgi:hypothetical protein
MAVLATTLSLLTVLPVAASSAQAPYEPNESLAQAYGPLLGGTSYTAGWETENDADWYYFYAHAQAQLDISFMPPSSASGAYCGNYTPVLHDEAGRVLAEGSVFRSGDQILYTVRAAGRYLLELRPPSAGCTYVFRIDPADAVTVNPPGATPPEEEPPENEGPPATDERSIACNTALRDVIRWTKKIKRAKQKLVAARSREAQRRWRNRLRLHRASRREAQRRANENC